VLTGPVFTGSAPPGPSAAIPPVCPRPPTFRSPGALPGPPRRGCRFHRPGAIADPPAATMAESALRYLCQS
jgi:hypothetical protein